MEDDTVTLEEELVNHIADICAASDTDRPRITAAALLSFSAAVLCEAQPDTQQHFKITCPECPRARQLADPCLS